MTGRSLILRFLLAVLLLDDVGAVVSAGQTAKDRDDNFKLPKAAAQNSPADLVRQFEAPEITSYTVDDGDEIAVNVWGRPELSGKHTIGPDGKITIPLIGSIVVRGKTREEAQDTIKAGLTPYYANVAVTVGVDHYSSFRIMILGRVGVPGALVFDRQPRLLDVLTKAASLPIGGFGSDRASLVRCAIFRGRDRVLWVDLNPLLNEGRLELNIRLERNDLVYLPDANDQLVYVLGYVKTPGAIHLTTTMSFLDALSLSGGPTEDAGLTHIELIRPSTGQQIEIPFKTILTGQFKLNYSLKEGDIIYVPPRTMAKFGYVLQKISPVTGFAVLGTVAKP